MKSSLSALALSVTMIASVNAQEARPAVPVDPIIGILEAFRTHRIVALGEGAHGNEQGAAFRLALVRDPRFAATVNDIVVEWGNARYQDVMDRFVRGKEVPDDVLRQVWQNTTQPHTLWDVPIYEEFFRTVRDVNSRLPRDRRLRVLLGDPPVDWDTVHSAEDFQKWAASPTADRDRHPAGIIQREVLAKKRRALVIYGDMHLNRRTPRPKPGSPDGSNNLVDLIVQSRAATVFTIHTETFRVDLSTLQSNVSSWSTPSLALLRGTVLGKADFTGYYPARDLIGADGKPLYPRAMEQQFDAVLYLAPPSRITMSRLPPGLCADRTYMKMRLHRLTLIGMKKDIDRLHEQCVPASSARPGALAARLLADRAADWMTVEVPGVQIHMRPGSPAALEARAIAESVSLVRRELLVLLGAESGSPASPAHLFFVSSRDDTQRLTGRPLVGFVQSDEPTGVFVYTPGYRYLPLLRHELTHLYAFQNWGATTAGPWLVEGLAVWAAGACQGHSADEFAAGALARGELVSVKELATRFRELSEVVAMPQAGSVVGFLVQRGGLATVRQHWRRATPPLEHPLGADGPSLERAWLDKLRGVRPAHPDVPRLMKEGC